jgi:hypothetical protein
LSATVTLSEREVRVRRHVAYTYLLNECLRRDERSGLYVCPGRLSLLIMMPMMERVFDFDLFNVPGFYGDPLRDARKELAASVGLEDSNPDPGWMVNLPEKGFVRPVTDDRGRVTALHVLSSPRDSRPKVLTSKGLLFGS